MKKACQGGHRVMIAIEREFNDHDGEVCKFKFGFKFSCVV
jgi:hypothetical protein